MYFSQVNIIICAYSVHKIEGVNLLNGIERHDPSTQGSR